MDEDFLLAIQLQEQFDNEYETSLLSTDTCKDDGSDQSSNSKKRRVESGGGSDVIIYSQAPAHVDRPMSIVDDTWETLDPNPDVRAMFLGFNDVLFWGKLCGVEVKWSPRMTLCAGVCSYEGRGGLCSIRLSEPLLKLRPRRDLVQTLLHEMIHALLFVTQNNRDRDGHGPEFCKHMNRINSATGTKITVYHSFHDEVDVYRQHWWRCDGPCRGRGPYFGYVKRAMNRAPSAQDPWWSDHQRTCGGTYTKVKEPEGYAKKGGKGAKEKGSKEKTSMGNGKPSSASPGLGSSSQDIRNILPFSGKGFLLGGSSSKPPDPAPESPTNPSSPAPGLPRWRATGSSSIPPVWSAAGVSGGQRPPVKRSVGNTNVFVNIDGSPVRIPKPFSSRGDRTAFFGGKQRSIQDLFDKTSANVASINASIITRPPAAASLASSTASLAASAATVSRPPVEARLAGNAARINASAATVARPPVEARLGGINAASATISRPPDRGPPGTQPDASRYFSDAIPAASSGGLPASRKRPRDGLDSPAGIFSLFQKTGAGGGSMLPREKMRGEQGGASAAAGSRPSSSSSSGPHNATSTSSLTVSCPVCQAEVQESKINQHLDACLS